MTNTSHCPVCRAPAEDTAAVSDAIIESGNVIYVSGVEYAAFEALTRHVFSQMPSDFQKHSGACFAKYRSSGCHNFDFTLVVTGEDNVQALSVLQDLLSRVENIFAFGPMSAEETALLTGGSISLPRKVGRVSSIGVTDLREYFADAMKTALVSMTKYSTL